MSAVSTVPAAATAPAAPFAVRLPLFEGPFDLLLFFIERDEVDIRDIPIARITADFMAYLRQLEALDVEVAADFILTAATLMRIKARLLLPRQEIDAATGQEIDPRQDLARHLLEYRRFKAAVSALAVMEAEMLACYPRGYAPAEQRALTQQVAVNATPDEDLHDVTLYKLLRAFERTMARFGHAQTRLTHTVYTTAWAVTDQKAYLRQRVAAGARVAFSEVVAAFATERTGLIFTFIALLELLQTGEVRLEDSTSNPALAATDFNGFWLLAPAPVAAAVE